MDIVLRLSVLMEVWISEHGPGPPPGGTWTLKTRSPPLRPEATLESSAFLFTALIPHFLLKALYNTASRSPIHAHIHTPTAESATQGDSQLRSSQGEAALTLGGAGDRTSNLPVTSQPAVPPEPHAAVSNVLTGGTYEWYTQSEG